MENMSALSPAFLTFLKEAPAQAAAWTGAAQALGTASELEPKTEHLAYLAVLSALRLHDGLAFHAALAKKAGATRGEIIGAVLVGLPAAGNAVVSALPIALAVYDGAEPAA